MFRRTRIKIMALVMAVLIGILGGTLAIIYFTTYREINQSNREMLEMYAQMYAANGNPQEAQITSEEAASAKRTDSSADDAEDLQSFVPAETGDPANMAETSQPADLLATDADSTRRYVASTFYSVAFSADGEVLEITNDTMPLLDDDDVTALAKSFLDGGKTFGTKNNVVYLITTQEDYILVTMMDNTVLGESIDALVHYTLLFGCLFIVAAFILSVFLSKWIVKPLQRSDEKQKQFLRDAGHELKTPISTISANAELLARQIGENQWLSNIQYENNRMMLLVRQLLDLAKLSRTQQHAQTVDLSHLTLAGILPFEGIAFEHKLQLDYTIEENISIQGDPTSLGELISILLDNAVSHTQAGGHIRIQLSALHDGCLLLVASEGEPIPEGEREKIFEPFYRMDTSRSQSPAQSADTADPAVHIPAGTQDTGQEAFGQSPHTQDHGTHYGLGLSIAQAAAQAHHAKISVTCRDGYNIFDVHFRS